ncbi:MAG: M23 family metallopeptidase [Bacteroidota bacterium]
MKKRHVAGILYFSLVMLACSELRYIEAVANSKLKMPRAEPRRAPDDIESLPTNSKVFVVFPVSGKSRKNIIGRFGEPRGGGTRFHEGVDIEAPIGTPVYAVASGVVTSVKEGGNGGKQVWMEDRSRGHLYYYAHLNSQSVQQGQRVQAGTEVGKVGRTGNAQTPHLHFGVYEPGYQAIDPMPFMP